MICMPDLIDVAKEGAMKAKTKVEILCFGNIHGCVDLNEKLKGAKAPDGDGVHTETVVSANETCLVVWSSGTTGKSKGIIHTHKSLMSAVLSKRCVEDLCILTTCCFQSLFGIVSRAVALAFGSTQHQVGIAC